MNSTPTIGSLYQELSDDLANAGIEEPRLEARLLLSFAANFDQSRIFGHPEDKIDAETVANLKNFARRRKIGEPIAYITRQKEFWSLTFKVSRDALIPRPDSETLIAAVLDTRPNRETALSILDLGTGTGCLLLALLSEYPKATGVGIDVSAKACQIALENAKILGLSSRVDMREGDWLNGLTGQFDIIVSNPPYIVDAEIATLKTDVRQFEPRLALSGGPDGLAAYRLIAEQCADHLLSDGLLAVECGIGQAPEIKHIFLKKHLKVIRIYKDISNVERCILATVEKT